MLKKSLIIVILLCTLIAPLNAVRAAFGVSPPYIISKIILPGSHYEQVITLLRSEAEEDLSANVVIRAPEIADWITIDKGMAFDMPAGKIQVPITISIDPPENAAIQDYDGKIDINVSGKNTEGAKGISLATGAQIEIKIGLTRDIYRDFSVKAATITDLELPKKPWDKAIFNRFFRRLKISLKIENSGNTPIAPTKVVADIYDITEENLLESAVDDKIKEILPFQTKDVVATPIISIGPGQYWAKIKVYKGEDIVYSNKTAFTISSSGPFKKSDLIPWGVLFVGLIIIWFITVFVFKISILKSIYRLFKFLYLKLIKTVNMIKKFYAKLKIKFWKWVYDKILKGK